MTDRPRTTGASIRPQVLVVEDERGFAELIALWLDRHGFGPQLAGTAGAALALFEASEPALVLLDLGLPDADGWSVLGAIREKSRVPILLVTARGTESEKVRGLRAGADDYITKPLSFPELMARVQAALRRARPVDTLAGDGTIRSGRLVIDPTRHRLQVGGTEVHLTPTEFRLLQHLAERPDRVISHQELLEVVWGKAYAEDTHLLQVTIRNLRAKLAAVTDHHFVATVYGTGYRFAGD